MEKNSFWRKLLAFVLSVLVVAIVFPTIFAVPLEFLIMNGSTYSGLAHNEKLLEAGQDAFSDYITAQLSTPGENEVIPPVFENTDVLSANIKNYVTKEWLGQTLTDVSGQLLQFLNFKQPFGIVTIDLTEVKEGVLADRQTLVENILNSSAPCSTEQLAQLSSSTLSIKDMPLCNPPAEVKNKIVTAVSSYVETFIYKVPQEYQINIEDVMSTRQSDSLFSYSMLRWLFRVLPVFFLVLLILIAICLGKNKKEMRTWLGRLLTIAASLSLILILVLLIGSEQFTALFINRMLSAENSAFGTLLLIVLQETTYKTLLWMGVIAAGLFCVGLAILFVNKISIKRAAEKREKEELQYQESANELLETKQAMAEAVAEEEVQTSEIPVEDVTEKKKRKTKKQAE
jgi:hypothetical protein